MDRRFGSAAILAGGESRRMGFDKAMLTCGSGRRNLDLLAESLSARFPDVFIVRRRGLYERTPLPPGVRVVYDDMDEPGPMTGVVSAMAHSVSEYVFVCACDAQPVCAAYLDLLIGMAAANRGGAGLAIAHPEGAGLAAGQPEGAGQSDANRGGAGPSGASPPDAVLPRIGGYIQPFWSLYGVHLLPHARAAVQLKRQSPFRFIQNRNIYIIEESAVAAAGVPVSMFSNYNFRC